jgi:hypothetical protein
LAAETDPQVERWDAERKAGLFSRVFDTAPAFVWNGAVGAAAAARRVARRRPARLRLTAS